MTVQQQKTLCLALTAIGLLMAFLVIAYCIALILGFSYLDKVQHYYMLPLAVISLPLAKYSLIKYEKLDKESQK